MASCDQDILDDVLKVLELDVNAVRTAVDITKEPAIPPRVYFNASLIDTEIRAWATRQRDDNGGDFNIGYYIREFFDDARVSDATLTKWKTQQRARGWASCNYHDTLVVVLKKLKLDLDAVRLEAPDEVVPPRRTPTPKLQPTQPPGTVTRDQLADIVMLNCAGYDTASCCAFALGDVAVIKTKKAFLVPVDSMIHVFLREAVGKTPAYSCYVPEFDSKSNLTGRWELHSGWSQNLRKLAPFLTKQFEGLTARQQLLRRIFEKYFDLDHYESTYDITIVMEAPPGLGICEEPAVSVALARALLGTGAVRLKPYGNETSEDLTCMLAGLITGTWYDAVSFSSIYACYERDPKLHSEELRLENVFLRFDRSKKSATGSANDDDDYELLDLATRMADGEDFTGFEQSIVGSKSQWMHKWGYIPGASFSIWVNLDWAPAAVDRFNATARFPYLRTTPFGDFATMFSDHLGNTVPDRIGQLGRLMRIHQLLLDVTGIVPELKTIGKELAALDADLPIAGCKMAHARGGQAIVVLTKDTDDHAFRTGKITDLGFRSLDLLRQAFWFDEP